MKIYMDNISKAYGGKNVITDLSYVFESGRPTVIKGRSGVGKTTLLRLIEGLEKPDSGKISYEGFKPSNPLFSPVFQEMTLIPHIDAVKNIKLACPHLSDESIREHLNSLIPAFELEKKVRDLSVGTARRVEIVRAVLNTAPVVVMDEPLAGLDFDTGVRVCSYIKDNICDRIFICSSHSDQFDGFCGILPL